MLPIFGEETGELIDFTKLNGQTARLHSMNITNVKQPLLGQTHPSKVEAVLQFSLKDLSEEQRA